MNPSETVQSMYAAFSRGDVPAILAHVADDVEWEYGSTTPEVPWLKPRKGRSGAAEFFAGLDAITFEKFQPKTFLSQDRTVVVLVDLIAMVKATGRRVIEEDEAHIWHFNAAGKVARFRHRVDTHQHLLAVLGK
jgi:uncharacterized protein